MKIQVLIFSAIMLAGLTACGTTGPVERFGSDGSTRAVYSPTNYDREAPAPSETYVGDAQELYRVRSAAMYESKLGNKADREEVQALVDAHIALYLHQLAYPERRLRRAYGQSVVLQRNGLQKEVRQARTRLNKRQKTIRDAADGSVIADIIWGEEDLTPVTLEQELIRFHEAEARRAFEMQSR